MWTLLNDAMPSSFVAVVCAVSTNPLTSRFRRRDHAAMTRPTLLAGPTGTLLGTPALTQVPSSPVGPPWSAAVPTRLGAGRHWPAPAGNGSTNPVKGKTMSIGALIIVVFTCVVFGAASAVPAQANPCRSIMCSSVVPSA